MESQPDIVLFLADQLRHDQWGRGSDGHFPTPNLDAFASRGCGFEQAYSASTVCVPARSALLTGMHPHRLPTQQNGLSLREGFWTMARALAAAGYETAAIGKMHFAPVHADHGFETLRLCEHLSAQGLDLTTAEARADHTDDYHDWLLDNGYDDWRYDGEELCTVGDRLTVFPHGPEIHPTGWVERETLEFLARRDRSRPLFLVVSFPHPHAPYNPPEPYASMFDPADSILPSDGYEVNQGLPPAFAGLAQTFGGRPTARVDPDDDLPLRRFLACIRGLVVHIDDAFGRLVSQLDLGTTLVGFTSDHGDYSGHRGLLRKNPWVPFEDLARVPLVVAGPSIPAGTCTSAPVQSFDFVSTALDLAGVTGPEELGIDARSLVGPSPDRAVHCGFTGLHMIRLGDLKYVWWEGWQTGVLFDLGEDPGETHDRSGDPRYAAALADLRERLQVHLNRRHHVPH